MSERVSRYNRGKKCPVDGCENILKDTGVGSRLGVCQEHAKSRHYGQIKIHNLSRYEYYVDRIKRHEAESWLQVEIVNGLTSTVDIMRAKNPEEIVKLTNKLIKEW